MSMKGQTLSSNGALSVPKKKRTVGGMAREWQKKFVMGREGSRTETRFLILKGSLKSTDKGGEIEQFIPTMCVLHGNKEVLPTTPLQGPGALAGETFRIPHSSGLSYGSMVYLGLLLAALSHGSGGAGIGREASPYHKLYPRLFIYVNCFYTTWHKSAGATLTLGTGERSPSSRTHRFHLRRLCLRQELPGSDPRGPEATCRLIRRRIRTAALSWLH